MNGVENATSRGQVSLVARSMCRRNLNWPSNFGSSSDQTCLGSSTTDFGRCSSSLLRNGNSLGCLAVKTQLVQGHFDPSNAQGSIQIEYEFTASDPDSERLLQWYEVWHFMCRSNQESSPMNPIHIPSISCPRLHMDSASIDVRGLLGDGHILSLRSSSHLRPGKVRLQESLPQGRI